MNNIHAGFKVLAFTGLNLIVVPAQSVVLLFTKGRLSYILPHFYHKSVCAIFRIKAERAGTPYTASQVLYMSNHISYLDIPLMGSLVRDVSFVAKKDVARWPVWGYLSKLQQTAFISRKSGDAKKESGTLDTMLENGKNLTIFPEGTSTDGSNVLDFKSSLFSLALKDAAKSIIIQPVTLQIITADGQSVQTHDERNIYAWPRELDMELHHHLWRFAKTSGAVIRVTFHDIMHAQDFEDRKTLAKACHETVCKGLEISNAA